MYKIGPPLKKFRPPPGSACNIFKPPNSTRTWSVVSKVVSLCLLSTQCHSAMIPSAIVVIQWTFMDWDIYGHLKYMHWWKLIFQRKLKRYLIWRDEFKRYKLNMTSPWLIWCNSGIQSLIIGIADHFSKILKWLKIWFLNETYSNHYYYNYFLIADTIMTDF